MKKLRFVKESYKELVKKISKKNIKVFIKRLPIYTLASIILIFYLLYKLVVMSIVKVYYMGRTLQYGILKPCYRCVYQKSHEPILIYSFRRGPRIVVKYKNRTYVRHGKCIGFSKCGKCTEAIEKTLKNIPCSWVKL